jgi:pimeloyl-ACP methyl ester carboxylesterase
MSGWTAGRCPANGIELHYLRTGGDKPPVVLLHGLTASGACWTPVAQALESECDLVLPDARGHGSSGVPAGGYRYGDFAADVVALMDALGLAAPVLLGHSMGGMTAAVVASRDPRRLSGLVLVDPTFLGPERQREVYESDVAEQHQRVLGRPKAELLADIRRRHAHRSTELVELLAEAKLRTDARAFDVLTPPNPDFRLLVQQLAVPTLLVIGDSEAGAVVSREVAADLARLNPILRVERIAGAGHGIPYDQPRPLANVVHEFVRTLRDCACS